MSNYLKMYFPKGHLVGATIEYLDKLALRLNQGVWKRTLNTLKVLRPFND